MLRLPRRTRGVVMGLVTLVIGPVVAASSVTPTHSVASAATVTDVVYAGAHLHMTIPEVAERQTPPPTPAPTPVPRRVVSHPRLVPPPTTYPPGSVEAIVMAAAAANGVDGNWMIRIGRCESGLRPNAVSRNGLYFGMFQFLPSTFAAHGGTNIFDPVQQANITAFMLAHGGARSWPVCSLR